MQEEGDPRERSRYERELEREERNRERQRHRQRSRSPYNSNNNSSRQRSGSSYNRERDRSGRDRDRYYRRDDTHRRDDDRRYHRQRNRPPKSSSSSPRPGEDLKDRDQRTVFVRQLAARLRTKEFAEFFEKAGPVRDASIVKDRVSGRSKGVGYVEFVNIESVQKAIEMTGDKLLGIPVIVELTEAEKNRQAAVAAAAAVVETKPTITATDKNGQFAVAGESNTNIDGRPTDKGESRFVYVANITTLTEDDLRDSFAKFGEIENIVLQDGNAYIQFGNKASANNAVKNLSTDEWSIGFCQEEDVPSKVHHNNQPRSKIKPIDRNELMERLMRPEDRPDGDSTNIDNSSRSEQFNPPQEAQPVDNPKVAIQSRCVLLKNMFDPKQESGDDWVEELEQDVKEECEEKYGEVLHIAVDAETEGHIYLKFKDNTIAEIAVEGLNGRKFDGRTVAADQVVEMVYKLKYPKSD